MHDIKVIYRILHYFLSHCYVLVLYEMLLHTSELEVDAHFYSSIYHRKTSVSVLRSFTAYSTF